MNISPSTIFDMVRNARRAELIGPCGQDVDFEMTDNHRFCIPPLPYMGGSQDLPPGIFEQDMANSMANRIKSVTTTLMIEMKNGESVCFRFKGEDGLAKAEQIWRDIDSALQHDYERDFISAQLDHPTEVAKEESG
jgi:hypothetical protein